MVERERPGEGVVFARSGTVGAQKFPVHWGGDCWATFEAMAEDLRGGLSFCSCGPAFWSHDIGGFEGTANPANYKRWVAFGLMSTHSRLHGSGSYRVPWLFDDESVDVMRQFTKLKNRLFPYLYAASHAASNLGEPVLRTMFVEYPNDPACRYLDRQYMLGWGLLVAPVFREDDVAEYYLPAGKWTNLISGKVEPGGRWISETLNFFEMPLFVRENTVLPMSENEQQPIWSAADPLVLQMFEIAPDAHLTVRVPGVDGKGVTFTLRAEGNAVTLESDGGPAKVSLLLRNRKLAGGPTNGRSLRRSPEGETVEWTNPAEPLRIKLDPSR